MASELSSPTDTTLIDTDIHNGIKDPRDLLPFLAKPWHKQWLTHGTGVGMPYYSTVGVLRRDAIPDSRGFSGSDPAYMIKDHLDRYAIDYGILTCVLDGLNGDGAVIDDGVVSAEGAYTVAYPLATIASLHGREDLAEQAVRQILLRRDCLTHERNVYLRYHQDTDTHSYRNWARAFAWYMLGTTRTYIELKTSIFASLPLVAEIEHELIRVAEVALSWIQPCGLWSNFLDEPETGIDTSGLAGIATALALGAKHGVLPE